MIWLISKISRCFTNREWSQQSVFSIAMAGRFSILLVHLLGDDTLHEKKHTTHYKNQYPNHSKSTTYINIHQHTSTYINIHQHTTIRINQNHVAACRCLYWKHPNQRCQATFGHGSNPGDGARTDAKACSSQPRMNHGENQQNLQDITAKIRGHVTQNEFFYSFTCQKWWFKYQNRRMATTNMDGIMAYNLYILYESTNRNGQKARPQGPGPHSALGRVSLEVFVDQMCQRHDQRNLTRAGLLVAALKLSHPKYGKVISSNPR